MHSRLVFFSSPLWIWTFTSRTGLDITYLGLKSHLQSSPFTPQTVNWKLKTSAVCIRCNEIIILLMLSNETMKGSGKHSPHQFSDDILFTRCVRLTLFWNGFVRGRHRFSNKLLPFQHQLFRTNIHHWTFLLDD